jgi:hypothetical protein
LFLRERLVVHCGGLIFIGRAPEYKLTPVPREERERGAFWRDLTEGFRYVRNRPRVSSLLLLSGINSLFGAPYFTLVPIYARDIFGLGETGLAMMMGTAGAGAFFGALLVAYLGDWKRKGWLVLGGSIAFGIFIANFASRLALRCRWRFLFGVGFSLVVCVSTINTLLAKTGDGSDARARDEHVYSFVPGNDADRKHHRRARSPTTSARNTRSPRRPRRRARRDRRAIFNKRLRDLH